MGLFGPKPAVVPPFDRNRPRLDPAIKASLVQLGWIDEEDQPAIKEVSMHADIGVLRVRFGRWDAQHFGLWTQIGRATKEGRTPYPFTRVKTLPYGFGALGSLLVLARI